MRNGEYNLFGGEVGAATQVSRAPKGDGGVNRNKFRNSIAMDPGVTDEFMGRHSVEESGNLLEEAQLEICPGANRGED